MLTRSQGGNKRTAYTKVGFWMEPNGNIHVSFPDLADGHVAVSNDPTKPYGHPTLFKRLADALREVGAPAPV
jgi:hypothetical protein